MAGCQRGYGDWTTDQLKKLDRYQLHKNAERWLAILIYLDQGYRNRKMLISENVQLIFDRFNAGEFLAECQ